MKLIVFMSVAVPQVAVPYDDNGNIPLRYHYHRKKKKKRGGYSYESLYYELFEAKDKDKAENLDNKPKEKVPENPTDTENPNDTQNPNNNQDDYSEDYGSENEIDYDDEYPPHPEPYKARVDDDDPDDSPYEAAQKKNKKQSKGNLQIWRIQSLFISLLVLLIYQVYKTWKSISL